jgi:hypothetical protein
MKKLLLGLSLLTSISSFAGIEFFDLDINLEPEGNKLRSAELLSNSTVGYKSTRLSSFEIRTHDIDRPLHHVSSIVDFSVPTGHIESMANKFCEKLELGALVDVKIHGEYIVGTTYSRLVGLINKNLEFDSIYATDFLDVYPKERSFAIIDAITCLNKN